jgi:hypothetical protein
MARNKIDEDKYKPVPGYPGYFVSECGEIIGRYGRAKKPQQSPSGYLRVNAQVNGKAKKLNIAEAVVAVFGGPPPKDKPWWLHADGDKANNHVSNLRWVDHHELENILKRLDQANSPEEYQLKDKSQVGHLSAIYTLEEEEEVTSYDREYATRPPKPGRIGAHARPPGDESNQLPKPDGTSNWTEYIRLTHQRLFQSDLEKNEFKVLLVFINYALQEEKDPKRYINEYEVGCLTKLERSPLSKAILGLKGRGLLMEPPELPAGSFYFALNARHSFFHFNKEDILKVNGDDYEELHKVLIPDGDLPPMKRAAIEKVYVPAVLSKDTWLTAEQVAELCCVTVECVHKHSSKRKLKEYNPPADVLRCLMLNGKGEKRFEWPEVDRWRHAIFFSPRQDKEFNQSMYPHRGNQPYQGGKSQSHAYLSRQHWSQKKR